MIHGTQRFRDRVPLLPAGPDDRSTGVLGSWYATLLRWRPIVALFVNETTLLPVLVPLAPARTLPARLPDEAASVLAALDVPRPAVEREATAMTTARVAPTSSRSTLGVMNEFAFLADHFRYDLADNLPALSVRLAGTPLGPLRARHGTPDRELQAVFDTR